MAATPNRPAPAHKAGKHVEFSTTPSQQLPTYFYVLLDLQTIFETMKLFTPYSLRTHSVFFLLLRVLEDLPPAPPLAVASPFAYSGFIARLRLPPVAPGVGGRSANS